MHNRQLGKACKVTERQVESSLSAYTTGVDCELWWSDIGGQFAGTKRFASDTKAGAGTPWVIRCRLLSQAPADQRLCWLRFDRRRDVFDVNMESAPALFAPADTCSAWLGTGARQEQADDKQHTKLNYRGSGGGRIPVSPRALRIGALVRAVQGERWLGPSISVSSSRHLDRRR